MVSCFVPGPQSGAEMISAMSSFTFQLFVGSSGSPWIAFFGSFYSPVTGFPDIFFPIPMTAVIASVLALPRTRALRNVVQACGRAPISVRTPKKNPVYSP
jgi:hypothetical protein